MSWFDESMLASLTEPQRQAVTHVDGPLLVLAGPGSGKTRVITNRVGYLIAQGIPAWSILALTFTNKAAGEMRQRIDAMVPADVPGRRGLTVTTFHAFCSRLLRRYAEAQRGGGGAGVTPGAEDQHGQDARATSAGSWFTLTPRFTIYDARDQRDAIKQALTELELDTGNWPPATIAASISKAKNRLIDAGSYASQAGDFYTRSVAKIFATYQRILARSDAVDFDDLLLLTARVLRHDQAFRAQLQQRFQYLLIDEYQDTNHAQFVIAHTLAAGRPEPNICVVGDPDQSIYGWRGADLNNILEFEQHYPRAKIIALGQNFRSTGHIVAAAAALIQCNRWRKHKDLHTALGEGQKPAVVTVNDEQHEAALVVDELRKRHEEGTDWHEMAVLYRINALSRVLEETFRGSGIPYVIARGTAFYERKEIKDALSYLRLIANPNDEVSLQRIINTPARGISKATLDAIEVFAMNRQLSVGEALRQAGEAPGLTARAVAAVQKFTGMIEAWREWAEATAAGELGPPDAADVPADARDAPGDRGALAVLVERVIAESGMEATLRKTGSEEDEERLANLAELVSAAAQFLPSPDEDREAAAGERSTMDTLRSYLESVALVSDQDAIDSGSGAVTLMTLHAAKGLEFDGVAMVGLEEGLLPHSRAAIDERELEEERRLCFVGMTRARKHLLMTRAIWRTQRGLRERTIESQFLRELPADAILVSDQTDDERFVDEGDSFDHADFGSGPSYPRPRTGRTVSMAAHAAADSETGVWMEFPVGTLVRHPSFGLGRIEGITRQRQGTRARVSFTVGGAKTLILEYANLRRVE